MAIVATAAGCATVPAEPAVTAAADSERTINTLRAQNGSYVRQIEELQNRVFILEDRLDSQRVVDQQRVPPALPVVKTLRAEPPPARPVAPPVEPPPPETISNMPADSAVEYGGEAARPSARARPVLQSGAGGRPPALAPSLAPLSKRPAPKPAPMARAKVSPAAPAPAARRPTAVAVTPPAVPRPAPVPAAVPSAPPAPPPAVAPSLTQAPIREGSELRETIPAEPLRVYRDALEALRAGHHAAALAGFRRFIDRYPVHDYADNAQYWIGECYYDLHQYQAATREFRAVIERYPHGNKVPDAMLKLGFSHVAMGQPGDGRQVLDALVRAYPKHSSATLATARLAEPPFGSKIDVSLGTITPRNAGTR